MSPLPHDTDTLLHLVRRRLFKCPPGSFTFNANGDLKQISAVLFLLGNDPLTGKPVLILNKRSRHVRQPGDLCCPGGGVSPTVDNLLTRLLHLPVTPLSRWPLAKWWRRYRRSDFTKLSLLLATGLREGFEEMRLNPFGVTFLGPLPVQHLVLFKRAIYPLVGWVNRQQRFYPNWEVERIVRIPVADFFNPDNYARYRISFPQLTGMPAPADREMPCFVHRQNGHAELLWGATFRITATFLETIFGTVLPQLSTLPVIHRNLAGGYLDGSLLNPSNSQQF